MFPRQFRAARPTQRRASSFGLPDDAPSPPRRVSEVGFSYSVARSSRSGASAATTKTSGAVGSVTLPLTLYEYGFDFSQSSILDTTAQFPDDAGVAYLNSPAGQQLRRLEREYAMTVTQYIARSARLVGASLLVLGSGSSRRIMGLLKRGVASVVFVDTSSHALAALRSNMLAGGLDASVATEYVQADAMDFLLANSDDRYDVVLAVKCVGLVLSSAQGRTTEQFLGAVADVLAPDGSFITDQHEAFSDASWHGHPVGQGMPDELYQLATVGGRYAADVGYNWDVSHPDLDRVAEFRSSQSQHLVQTWRTVHFRKAHSSRPTPVALLSARKQRAPPPVPLPTPHPFDKVVDAMVPINHKGVKRVVTQSDVGSFSLATARPKFDGQPGLLVLDGRAGAFLSPVASAAVQLPAVVHPALVLTAEVVSTDTQDAVYVVNGVVSIGGVKADPGVVETLVSLVPVLDQLVTAGIVPSTPELMRAVRGNAVTLRGEGGRSVQLPVDGVNVVVGARASVFVKPYSMCSVDAKPAEVYELLRSAHVAVGRQYEVRAEGGTGDGVWEYYPSADGKLWTARRERPDKTRSDTLGAVIHTVSAAARAAALMPASTVEGILEYAVK